MTLLEARKGLNIMLNLRFVSCRWGEKKEDHWRWLRQKTSHGQPTKCYVSLKFGQNFVINKADGCCSNNKRVVHDCEQQDIASNFFREAAARRLRIIGLIVVLLGIVSAGIVYWLGTRAPDLSDDPSMVGNGRAGRRQMGVLYGKSGQLIEDLSNDLKQPGTQAIIIALVSAGITSGCFYFARLLENHNETR